MVDHQTIHVHDMKAEGIGIQFPDSEAIRVDRRYAYNPCNTAPTRGKSHWGYRR